MTINADIRVLDGPQLGRATLITPAEKRTLHNASKVVESLGHTPLAQNLVALTARLSHAAPPDAFASDPDAIANEPAAFRPNPCTDRDTHCAGVL